MLADLLRPADIALVVPPLAHLSWASLGVETLAALARRAGYSVVVIYANALLAKKIGSLAYAELANAPGDWLLGERLFARAAFGTDALDNPGFRERVDAHDAEIGSTARRYLDHLSDGAGVVPETWGHRYPSEALDRARSAAERLLDELAPELAERYPIVGCSSSFDQTTASIALLRKVKAASRGVTTLLGGANCDGDMGRALLAIAQDAIDHVFSGESEATFLAFLAGSRAERVIVGSPCADLDALPPPDLDDWMAALRSCAPDVLDGPVWLSYETSRGCWWGQKQHCTFCGLNGTGMGFRERSPERALTDLSAMFARYPTKYVAMTDNIMPNGYHRTFVPRLAEAAPGAHIFYEQKANLTLAQVQALGDAGIKVIQPGIESLSTSLLRRMRKGVTAAKNLDLLRYCRSTGVMVKWNLLYAFPGDEPDDYLGMIELLPHLTHLAPPNALCHLSIDRFSPYHSTPEAFGISGLKPIPAYADVFPPGAELSAIAYHFEGQWACTNRTTPEILGELWALVQRWREAWSEGTPPQLRLSRAGRDYVVTDTRGGAQRVFRLDRARAERVARGGALDDALSAWVVRAGLGVALEGKLAPIVTGAPDVLRELEGTRDSGPEHTPRTPIVRST